MNEEVARLVSEALAEDWDVKDDCWAYVETMYDSVDAIDALHNKDPEVTRVNLLRLLAITLRMLQGEYKERCQ